jgi:Family of unknown function (DUF5336)
VIVVYSPGNHDYQSAYPQSARPGSSADESRLPQNLFIAVAVLGLACYAFSFGPVVDGGGATGWYVRFSALAGLSAALGLAAKGRAYPMVTAVLAAMGFLDALSSQLLAADPGWALTTILVLNCAQTAVAVAALMLLRQADATDTAVTGYEAYAEYYNQAVRNYYSQQAPSTVPETSRHAGYGQAAGYGAQAAPAPRTQRAPQRGEYADLVSAQGDYGHAATPPADPGQPTPPEGLPRFGPGQPPSGRREPEAEQSAWPPSP